MAKRTIDQLKQWFETGDYPTQQQFWDWLDSFIHKDDELSIVNITGLSDQLQSKANSSQLASITPVVLAPGQTQWNAPAATVIEAIVFLTVGTKNISVGTTVGGSQIIEAADINTKAIFRPDYITAEETIYFTGVGADTTIKILKR